MTPARLAALVAWVVAAFAVGSADAEPRRAKSKPTAASAKGRAATGAGSASGWAGEWSGPWCGEAVGGGVAAGGCGTFVLTLVQRRDRLCGRHAGVPPASGSGVAGTAQSAIGKVKGGKATIVVTAGSPVASWLVQAERNGRAMTWRVVERLASPDAAQRPSDLPASAALSWRRDKAATDAALAECRSHFADPD